MSSPPSPWCTHFISWPQLYLFTPPMPLITDTTIGWKVKLLCALIRDFPPFTFTFPLLRLGHRIVDVFEKHIWLNIPSHPLKSSTLFPQWLEAWKCNTMEAINWADFSIGTYKGTGAGTAAFVIQSNSLIIHDLTHPCSANSSFNGKLTSLLDRVDYLSQHLHGNVLIITDNEAALCKQ